MSFVELDISLIDIPEDREWKVDREIVESIAESIKDRGLLNPIIAKFPTRKKRYKLLAGVHRLEAAKLLGWTTIAAHLKEAVDPLEAKLIEIDENMFRRKMLQLDKATYFSHRKEIYEILHPETKAGIAGATVRHHGAMDILSFAEDAATKLNVTERTVRRAVHRAKHIAPDVREKIATSWIADSGKDLDALTRLEPSEQMAVVTAMLEEETPPKSVKLALQIIRGEEPEILTPEEQQSAALQKAWVKASNKVQRQFLATLRELGVI